MVQKITMLGYKCDEDGECARLTCNLLKNLTEVSILDDCLPAPLYAAVGTLKNLTRLDLCHSKTTNADMKHIGSLTQLKFLNIYSNSITDIGLSRISNLKELITLMMGHNYEISGDGLAHLEG